MRLQQLFSEFFLILTTILILTFISSLCRSQFISHVSSKGLKGNITFNVREEPDGNILVIESLIEADQSRWLQGHRDEEEFDHSQPILFDWTLHSNTLDPQALMGCSSDELGPTVAETTKNTLTTNRPIVINKQNIWTIPLRQFLDSNSAPSLSALIWGKSIRLKLSSSHGDQIQASQSNAGTQLSPPTSSLSKPQLNPSGVNPGKPTFAPRPKPSLSAHLKSTSAPNLPKPEALIPDSTNLVPFSTESPSSTTSASTPVQSKEAIKTATHKRIVGLYGNVVACGNIVDTRNVKTAEAVFESQIAGKITMRGNEDGTTLLMLNLYHIRSKVTTRHDWKLMASDILDGRREDEKCKYLQVVFDPNDVDDSQCRRNDTIKCRMGDLTKKHGQVQVAGQGRNTRITLVDLNLPLSALEGSRSLFLVIYEVATKTSNNGLPSRPNILSCAQVKSVNMRTVEAVFNMDGVRGSIKVAQRHMTEPATIYYDLFGLEGNLKHLSIRELPLAARSSLDNAKLCSNLGEVYNPYKVGDSIDANQRLTVDSFKVGNLSAKHGQLAVIDSEYDDHYMGEFIDLSVQLYGPYTIAGRSILIQKNNGDYWVCATLNYIDEAVSLAVATFYYPVVGTISFEQLSNSPHSETGVLVEVYNPNSPKRGSSDGHNWMVHLKPAMADFYNWSQRCQSSGEVYDPVLSSIGLNNEVYARQCQASLMNEPLRCRLGDTGLKSGLRLALPTSHADRERHYYTDLFLPISGPNSIIGKSVVIYDEHAPTQRGNRLACSNIKIVHPIKASVKSWNSGPSIPSAVRGSITFEQESATKQTKIKIDLSGFNGNVENYAIHNVWTMDDREFPCSNDSLYDIYDPYNNENSSRLPPSAHYGALATADSVKVGDMSRKHGTFEGLQSAQKTFTDTNAPLFAPRSIVGRSIVLRAAVNDFRWVCGNIELDYDKSISREIIGVASYDETRSKISGFVRFHQLEFKDGSLSDTFIHVDLRMQSDGVHELRTSENHNWNIFVNQVGEDAYIAADDVRCIASGFKWNPYLAQDNLDTYPSFCNPSEQLGCAMGDLGMRHGSLTLGPNNRRTLSDSNLPLTGNFSIMGRSLIIFDNKHPNVKLACANIFPDVHLKSNVVLKRTPSFTVARFVEQMRSLLGAAEWLMVPELKATKSVANGECVQMTIHFYGQRAHQMQVELNNLITLGTVRKSTRVGGFDKISTHYKLCRAGQQQLIGYSHRNTANSYLIVLLFCLTTFCTNLIVNNQR